MSVSEQISPQLERIQYKYKKLTESQIQRLRQKQFETKLKCYKRQKEKFFRVSNNLKLIRFSNRSGSHINCFRFFSGENRMHIFKKLEICMELKNKKHEFITEAIFENGSRCDVLDLTDGVIYEVLNSETDEEFEKKIKKYPMELEIVKVRC